MKFKLKVKKTKLVIKMTTCQFCLLLVLLLFCVTLITRHDMEVKAITNLIKVFSK